MNFFLERRDNKTIINLQTIEGIGVRTSIIIFGLTILTFYQLSYHLWIKNFRLFISLS